MRVDRAGCGEPVRPDTTGSRGAAVSNELHCSRRWLPHTATAGCVSSYFRTGARLREPGVFLSFPYVCPEPVLVKMMTFASKADNPPYSYLVEWLRVQHLSRICDAQKADVYPTGVVRTFLDVGAVRVAAPAENAALLAQLSLRLSRACLGKMLMLV